MKTKQLCECVSKKDKSLLSTRNCWQVFASWKTNVRKHVVISPDEAKSRAQYFTADTSESQRKHDSCLQTWNVFNHRHADEPAHSKALCVSVFEQCVYRVCTLVPL